MDEFDLDQNSIEPSDILKWMSEYDDWLEDDESVEAAVTQQFDEFKSYLDELESAQINGEVLISEDHFVEHTKQLINECYECEELDSNDWPWRHLTFDYEAAAEEEKQNYSCIELCGNDFWIRS